MTSTTTSDLSRRPVNGAPRPSEPTEAQRLTRSLAGFYATRREDGVLADLATDMADRTLAEREGRALIIAAPSGAGKTSLVRRATKGHPDLSTVPDAEGRQGMVFVQVPPACTLADLGTEIARAAGYPARDGLKASVAWGAAMRVIHERRIKFLWIDEFTNVSELANVREARKIRNTVKMSLVNARHTMGIILSGDTSIVEFLRSDPHILRRSDVLQVAPVDRSMFKVIAHGIAVLAAKAELKTAPNLESEIVPRLVHAALGQFGTCFEITRVTIKRAVGRRSGSVLELDDYAWNWARAHGVGADANPFVTHRWAEVDVAAVLARNDIASQGLIR